MARILIIEDDELMADILVKLLKDDGHQVHHAVDGASGVQVSAAETPDLVITDMSLPKMTGWQVTEAIRANNATKHVPILGLTSYDTAGDRDTAFAAGISDFESKPLDAARIRAKIKKLLTD